MTDTTQPWQKAVDAYEQGINGMPVTYALGALRDAVAVLKLIAEIHPELLTDRRLIQQKAEGCTSRLEINRLRALIGTKDYPGNGAACVERLQELIDRLAAQAFEKAINAEDFSHISTRDRFGGMALSYRSDSSSPSGVFNNGSLSFSNRYYEPLMAHNRKTAHHGPQRGEMALKRQGY
jgi:hypothetical protein